MRTTVTIDSDTEALLKEEVRRSGRSFKVVLNESVRRSLSRPKRRGVVFKPLFKAPFSAALSGVNFNHLADEWDDEETLRELSS